MTAILELPEVRERVSPLSVEEYHRLGEYNEHGRRTDLIRGIIIQKMSKTPLHLKNGSSAVRATCWNAWRSQACSSGFPSSSRKNGPRSLRKRLLSGLTRPPHPLPLPSLASP